MKKLAIIAVFLLFASCALAQRCQGVASWSTTANYKANDLVQISGLLYKATKDNFCRNPCYPDAAWDPNPWQLVNTCDVDCSNAPTYSANTEYAINAIVKYGGQLYIALWGGNKGNRPDLNSGDWGAWKKLFKCQVCVQIVHDCASVTYSTGTLDAAGRVCVEPGTSVTFTATAQTDKVARVIGSNTQTLVVTQDTTVTFDCEYQVYVTLSGDCVVAPANGVYPFWPSDKSNFVVAVSAPVKADRACRINSITIDGSVAAQASLTNIQTDHTIVTDCECQVCVDISGDCVTNPSSRTCEYATDNIRLEVSVAAPVKEGYTCSINSITVDGTAVASVVFDPLNADHTVVADCVCVAICPHFYGCDNTPAYSSAQSQVYHGCDCVKQTFDCPSGPGTQIVFCAPEGATIRCDQNIYDGHLIWQGYRICRGSVVNYVSGTAYTGGSIVNEAGNCYVAKWWTSSKPSTNFGLYQEWRFIGLCANLV